MEGTETKNGNEGTENETILALTPKERAMQNSELMRTCFVLAKQVVGKEALAPEEGGRTRLLTKIALAIFGRSARVAPGQERLFEVGLRYVETVIKYVETRIKEKEAETEREEKLRANMSRAAPFMFGLEPSVLIASAATCAHPGLRTLHDYLREVGDVVSEIIEAMAISGPSNDNELFLLCPHCRTLVPASKVRNGELWNESAKASRKAAREKKA